eukprot:COSAG02_NODE_4027_length_5886_cov_4.820287_4_plen_86_part_00
MQRAKGAGLWPAAREFASVAGGGFMYGGIPASAAPPFECVAIDDIGTLGAHYSPRYDYDRSHETSLPRLSGMWRWHDGEGTEFYQ